jgi:hypothetical protein
LLTALLMIAPPALAADTPKEGARLEFAVEQGSDGQDLLLDLGARGLRHDAPLTTGHWFGFHVSWDFQGGDGWEIVDRLELSFLEITRPFEQDRVTLEMVFIEATYDYDANTLDATALGGGVKVMLFDPYISAFVGLDLRYRAQATYWVIRNHSALIGIPLELAASWQGEIPVFVEGRIRVRPSIGVYGHAGVILEVEAEARGGYVVLDGEEVDILISVGGNYRLDTWTYSRAGGGINQLSEWTGNAGASLRF